MKRRGQPTRCGYPVWGLVGGRGVNSSPKTLGCSGILHKAQRVMGRYTRLRVFWIATQGSVCYGMLHKSQRVMECYTRLSVLWNIIQG